MPPKLTCSKLPEEFNDSGLPVVSVALDGSPQTELANAPWGVTGQMPDVQFSLAYDNGAIYLKYLVIEPTVRAEVEEIGGPVYEDSCVEFFIAFGDAEAYYNFEFNSLGVCLAGFGPGKQRQVFPVEAVSKIKVHAVYPEQDELTGLFHWSITIKLPLDAFIHHQITSLLGQSARVNFYKCGDLLPNPHFLTWAPIEHPFPEFHLPQFFGKLVFA
ncbi:carbohydrate-binding family 9-like protein [Mucilaginibacter pedocola]|uniref:Carbohydrate-binding domain-containing protein n=1 Tax=Mucilaginibacter pedocola TaxID=1792845 RepID=A0A1S9PF67_9SPHI|nr:carbohydrate-binding family 9-like protein [Mucilaginibacter pedocola]OOQ59539.1 hypothetical protein BC343_05045 [Mucilaginibacter pedocola]